MTFLKTSILSALSTIIRLTSGLVVNKIIAIYIGPAGIALIGQFQNFIGIITTIGNGGINSGVTKYVAEYNEKDNEKRDAFISASIIITFVASTIVGILLFSMSTILSEWVFKTPQYTIVFKILSITLFLIGANTILLSIINGLKRIKLFIAINIIGSILSLVFTSILTIRYGLWGALLSSMLIQVLLLFVSLPIATKKLKIMFSFQFKIPKQYYRKLMAFSLMTLVSVISLAVTQILIRNYLIENFSFEEAGYWQSVGMISTMYLMVLTTAFSTYYLPRLSELTDTQDIRREIISGYKIIIPFVLITAIAIYLLRDIVIILLFTKEFYPMRDLFLYQLIGDFFKMCSWSLSILLAAKAMTKTFIITELSFSIIFYIMVIFLTNKFGLEGITYAHAINYFLYFMCMIVIFHKLLFKR